MFERDDIFKIIKENINKKIIGKKISIEMLLKIKKK